MRKTNIWLMLAGLIIAAGLLVGWRYPQGKANSWDYKIVPVNNVKQGEQVLKDMDGQGWELIAVQPVRTQTELVPRAHPAQALPIPPPSRQGIAGLQPEAMYFFRRAK